MVNRDREVLQKVNWNPVIYGSTVYRQFTIWALEVRAMRKFQEGGFGAAVAATSLIIY